jgi:hypothetical protein
VDDALLPTPPLQSTGANEPAADRQSTVLPRCDGSHDWDALQAAVNDASASFTSPEAKSAWKKWALSLSNVSLVVSLFWWVVADVFKPDHPQSSNLKVSVI